jgi:hypothetical protein
MATGRYSNTSNTSGNVPFEFGVYTKAEFQDDRFIFAEYVHSGESSLKLIRKKLTSSLRNSGGTSAAKEIETHDLNAIVVQPLPQSIEILMLKWPVNLKRTLRDKKCVHFNSVAPIAAEKANEPKVASRTWHCSNPT